MSIGKPGKSMYIMLSLGRVQRERRPDSRRVRRFFALALPLMLAMCTVTSPWPLAQLPAATPGQEDAPAATVGDVLAMDISPDGGLLATGDRDTTVRLWDLESRRVLQEWGDHLGVVSAVAFSADGKLLASGDQDGNIFLREVSSGTVQWTLPHQGPVTCICFSPEGWIASGGGHRDVVVWHVDMKQKPRVLHTLPIDLPTPLTYACDFSPDGKTLAVGNGLRIQLWDVTRGKRIDQLQIVGHAPTIGYSPDGRWVVAVRNAAVKIAGEKVLLPLRLTFWETDSGKETRVLESEEAIAAVAFSPDGKSLATVTVSGTVRLLDLETWEFGEGVQTAHSWNVGSPVPIRSYPLVYSPDGHILATGGRGNIELIDIQTAKVRLLQDDGHAVAPVSTASVHRPEPGKAALALRITAAPRAASRIKTLGMAPRMKAQAVTFIRLDEGLGPYVAEHGTWAYYSWKERKQLLEAASGTITSNFERDNYVYFLNIEPGRYAAMSTVMLGRADLADWAMVALSGATVEETEIVVGPEEMAFVGDFRIDLERRPVEPAQVSVMRRLMEEPATESLVGQFGLFSRHVARQKDEDALKDFWAKTEKTFKDETEWSAFISAQEATPSPSPSDPDPREAEIRMLTEEAAALFVRDDVERALERAQDALRLAEGHYGPEDPRIAALLINLGDLQRMGRQDPTLSREPYERALSIREKTLGPEHPAVAFSLLDLAMLALMEQNYQRAVALAEQALAIRTSTLDPAHPHVAGAVVDLTSLYAKNGDFPAALFLLQRTIAEWEKAHGQRLTGSLGHTYGALLNNLAGLQATLNNTQEAEKTYRRLLDARVYEYGRESQPAAETLFNLSLLSAAQRDYDDAMSLMQEVTETRKAIHGEGSLAVGASLYAMAVLSQAAGRETGEVLGYLERGAGIIDDALERDLAVGSEEDKLRLGRTSAWMTDLVVSLQVNAAPEDPAAAVLALRTLLRRKGLVLDAAARNLETFRDRLDAEERDILDRLESARERLAALAGTETEDLGKVIKAEQKVEELEAELSAHGQRLEDTGHPITVAGVQDSLPDGAALVEIAAYRPASFAASTDEPRTPGKGASASGPQRAAERLGLRWGPARYVAYVLPSGGRLRWVELGDVAEIDALAVALRESLSRPDSRDYRNRSRALGAAVLDPLQPLLGSARAVFVVPDGELNLIPFAALLDGNGRFAVETYNFTYLATGRELLRIRKASTTSGRSSWIIANPDFDAGPEAGASPSRPPGAGPAPVRSRDFRNTKFAPLPGTETEARAIEPVIKDPELMLGADATEARIKDLSQPRLLHIATHGFFLEDQAPEEPDPGATEIALVMDTGGTPAELPGLENPRPRGLENPLLRSGLALAGANRLEPNGEDGLLTALEASGLDLAGTELVVLSACETGTGEVRTGEGVFGFRRALTLAGVRSQVMSLWQVADLAAPELMAAYYRRLNDGKGRAEALREVQLEMLAREELSHPFFWAAFIHSGDWRPIRLDR